MIAPSTLPSDPQLEARAVRALARSVYREMQSAGYSGEQVVDFASTMLDLLREQWSQQGAPR